MPEPETCPDDELSGQSLTVLTALVTGGRADPGTLSALTEASPQDIEATLHALRSRGWVAEEAKG